jgi:hypothetical protein
MAQPKRAPIGDRARDSVKATYLRLVTFDCWHMVGALQPRCSASIGRARAEVLAAYHHYERKLESHTPTCRAGVLVRGLADAAVESGWALGAQARSRQNRGQPCRSIRMWRICWLACGAWTASSQSTNCDKELFEGTHLAFRSASTWSSPRSALGTTNRR